MTTRRRHTDEFKREAVKLVTKQDYAVGEAARNRGVHGSLLRRWREELEAEGKGEVLNREERKDLRRLRAEVKRLQMEREILRTAAAFFAKESS
jgi:transposase